MKLRSRPSEPTASQDPPVQRDAADSAPAGPWKVRAAPVTASLLACWSGWHPNRPRPAARAHLRLDLP